MFGYIRPDAPQLRIKEFERFRACYCGLCHELGDKYGISARFILNYDFVFLAMLLWREDEHADYCFRRCLPAMCRKKCVSKSCRALSVCAGYSVILAYWKFCDSINDEKGFAAIKSVLQRLLLKRAYGRARADYKEFDGVVRQMLSELSELEKNNESSIDKSADKFATLLASAAENESDGKTKRALFQLLYHVGRIIYIADAYNDIKDDQRHKRYNPLVTHFLLVDGAAPKDVSDSVLKTLEASTGLAAAAYELLPKNYWSSITENIIYYGIPDMCEKVVAGTFNTKQKKLHKRPGVIPDRSENQ